MNGLDGLIRAREVSWAVVVIIQVRFVWPRIKPSTSGKSAAIYKVSILFFFSQVLIPSASGSRKWLPCLGMLMSWILEAFVCNSLILLLFDDSNWRSEWALMTGFESVTYWYLHRPTRGSSRHVEVDASPTFRILQQHGSLQQWSCEWHCTIIFS